MRKLPLIITMVVIVLALVGSGLASTQAADYHLDVGDQVRVKVLDWRSTMGDVHEWTGLTGDYRIGADGNVSLPLLGAIKAIGLTSGQLADAISAQLQTSLALTFQTRASVEIVDYRPFFILGDVNKPGAYSYRPGLTVLEAISVAGGRYRVSDPTLAITTAGELGVLHLQYDGLLARRARLQAELNDDASITFPDELLRRQSDPNIAQLIAREQAMFKSRRDMVNTELDSLNQLKSLLTGEVTSLQAKTKNVDQEVALTKKELDDTTALVQRGLAIAPREYTQHQAALQTESRRLDLDTASLRAKEDIGKADQAIIELRNKTRNDIETELADVEQKIPQIAARIASSETIIGHDSGANAAAQQSQVMCLITRRSGGNTKQIEADETALVEPGDTIKVLRADNTASQTAVPNPRTVDDLPPRGAKPPPTK
ncbi:MAG TPA: polysaccharide biosynthesis/export family protein [Stellaceae bacterium]|nr:polysaccharide biosynthesis/export family protein [Stellaceae bacterium]